MVEFGRENFENKMGSEEEEKEALRKSLETREIVWVLL
jgi:hypothetical protein